ncbi:MAG: RluA family pseudouridine synthase [Clostridiaceae bacterium]
MDNTIKYQVINISSKTKLRAYLKDRENISTRFLLSAAKEGRIKVNGKVEKLNYILKEKDIIEMILNRNESQNIEPEKMDIKVMYEDDDILVVDKPSNIVVHPTKSYPSNTLANGIVYYFREKGDKTIVRLVSRLDMNTSGLILIAKNQFSHMSLSRDKKEFQKKYIAVIHNHMEEEKGTIDLPIYRQLDGDIRRIVDDRGQNSITHYKIIERYEKGELLELDLETGRTHQIRVHLNYFNCPIYGDDLYCNEDDSILIGRQALHAKAIRFIHPRTQKIVNIESEIPKDIKNLIETLK